MERLQRDLVNERGRSPRCLVLEPTRELAKQVTDDFLSIKNRLLSISTLYGGKDYAGQESSLRQGSDVVVGTPGRIKDFLLRKKLLLHRCEILVLDEVDRMLDMGFQVRSSLVFRSLMCVCSGRCRCDHSSSVQRRQDETNDRFLRDDSVVVEDKCQSLHVVREDLVHQSDRRFSRENSEERRTSLCQTE